MKRKGIFVPTQQLEPSFRTARSTAVRNILGILMPRRNQIQTDPAAEHTRDCLLGRRERVTVRAGLAIPRHLPQEQSCWLFGSGWFLDLPYRVVKIKQVLNTGDVYRAYQLVCPAGSPGTVRWREVYFLWHCMIHHAVLGYCTKLCSSPHLASCATAARKRGHERE